MGESGAIGTDRWRWQEGGTDVSGVATLTIPPLLLFSTEKFLKKLGNYAPPLIFSFSVRMNP